MKSMSKLEILLLLILLPSCSIIQGYSASDQSFLTDKPCAAPCWYGLEPGKSTEEDVMKTLIELPFVDPSSIKSYGTVWQEDNSAKSIIFDCINPKVKECGEVLVSIDELRRLRVPTTNSLTFYSAVNKLGPPSYISYRALPPAGDCIVFIDWPDHGVSLSTIDNRSKDLCEILPKGGKMPPNTKVVDIFYFEKTTSKKHIIYGENFIEWPGFEKP
jgi:hypothetical protein